MDYIGYIHAFLLITIILLFLASAETRFKDPTLYIPLVIYTIAAGIIMFTPINQSEKI